MNSIWLIGLYAFGLLANIAALFLEWHNGRAWASLLGIVALTVAAYVEAVRPVVFIYRGDDNKPTPASIDDISDEEAVRREDSAW